MKRTFDLIMALFLFILFFPLTLCIYTLVKLTSPGPVIFWTKRIGKNNQIFLMPKFRTMLIETPQVATHLLLDTQKYLTSIGPFLRKSSLDEIPQLWSIIKGDMSFVGPRPALYNQDDLRAMRLEKGIHKLTPGLTGWAQVNGRDEIPIPKKVEYDYQYLLQQSFMFDLKILLLTIFKVIRRENIIH